MNRAQAVSTIETNAIGERLLAQAKRECENWRNLPDAVLFRYAELCMREEQRSTRGLLRRKV